MILMHAPRQLKISFGKRSTSHTQTNLSTVPADENYSATQTKGCNESKDTGFDKNLLVNAIKQALSCKCHCLPRVGLSQANRCPPYLELLSKWEPD
jgi:hypothetical protein